MKQTTYTTKQIADAVGVHVNTLRFYEAIGFLMKPARLQNGYRVYTPLHIAQCALIRRAMRAEVIQNGLRKKAVEIVRLAAALDFEAALAAAEEYRRLIDGEIERARTAIVSVEKRLRGEGVAAVPTLTRQAAAEALALTPETLRTWERSGLLTVARRDNGYRVYDAADMDRLNIIRTLRCANYSLSAILRLMTGLDRLDECSVEALLNTPGEQEDVVSVCDRLIVSLQSTAADAKSLPEIIKKIEAEATLQ